jgi:predicted GNAT family N-acyltransferase
VLGVVGQDRRHRPFDRRRRQPRQRLEVCGDLRLLDLVQQRQHLPARSRVTKVVARRRLVRLDARRADQAGERAGVGKLVVQEQLSGLHRG